MNPLYSTVYNNNVARQHNEYVSYTRGMVSFVPFSLEYVDQPKCGPYSLGCVNSPPAARGSQEAGITQPRAHLLADPCTSGMKIPGK